MPLVMFLTIPGKRSAYFEHSRCYSECKWNGKDEEALVCGAYRLRVAIGNSWACRFSSLMQCRRCCVPSASGGQLFSSEAPTPSHSMQRCGQHLSTAVSVPTPHPYPALLISFSPTLMTHPSIKVLLILDPCTFQKIISP